MRKNRARFQYRTRFSRQNYLEPIDCMIIVIAAICAAWAMGISVAMWLC